MPRKFRSKKILRKKGKSVPRRRLGAAVSTVTALAPYAVKAARAGYSMYKGYKKSQGNRARVFRQDALLASDNVVTLKTTVIGKPKSPTFSEKVSRINRPPILFKRNYNFNAECGSGRKGWFSFEFNIMNNNDLQADMTTYKAQQFTDTASADPTVAGTSSFDNAKFYVDYLSEKLSFMNSSTNSCFGKIHLFAHKRDNDNSYSANAIPITPINLMLYYSTNRLPALTVGNESTVGQGWAFNTSTTNSDYDAVYNMPGSSINASGVSAYTDTALSPSSPHIRDSMNFWFRKISTQSFNLKPGQQFNKTYVFNDLKTIMREEQNDFIHVAGVSFSCVVEFTSQLVGSSSASVGVGVVSTGISQLSVMRVSQRRLGIKNNLKPKVYLITTAPEIIGGAEQLTINADTGVPDVGVDIDT